MKPNFPPTRTTLRSTVVSRRTPQTTCAVPLPEAGGVGGRGMMSVVAFSNTHSTHLSTVGLASPTTVRGWGLWRTAGSPG